MMDAMELNRTLRDYPGSIAVVVGSHITALGMIRALGQGRIPILVVDYEANPAVYSRYVTQAIIQDYRCDWDEFAALLCCVGEQLQQRAVLYLTDERYCVLCAEAAMILSSYYHLPFNLETIRTVVSKAAQIERCEANSIPIPFTRTLKTPADVDALLGEVEILPYPLVIRPFDKSEYFDTQEPFRIQIIADSAALQGIAGFMHREISHGLLISEYIPGSPEKLWGFVAYCDERHQVVAGYTRYKISQYPYDTGSATIMKTMVNPEVATLGEKVCQALEVTGAAAVEFKYDDRSQTYKYIETNYRYPLSNMVCLPAGVNIPLIQYYHVIGDPRWKSMNRVQNARPGYLVIGLREWMNVLENKPRIPHLKRFLRGLLLPNRVWGIINSGDPRPGLAYGVQLLVKMHNRLFRRRSW